MKPRADWDAALFAAVQEGDLAKAGDALAQGADVNAVSPHGETPLEYAGRHKRPRAIRDLLK